MYIYICIYITHASIAANGAYFHKTTGERHKICVVAGD